MSPIGGKHQACVDRLNRLLMGFLVQLSLAGDRPTAIYPGTPQYINGISYWVLDISAGERVMRDTIG